MSDSLLTERGQVSVPASLRRAMGLVPGHRLHWEQISDREIRVSLCVEKPTGPMSVLGYARQISDAPAKRTDDWMRELREGE
jgi:bifunctional DNA-binding transcriptional regulator/antitoxin component of YhaV-PrlF toxin-antitoxin module